MTVASTADGPAGAAGAGSAALLVVAGGAVEGPGCVEASVDRRRDGSAFLKTVLTLDKTFPIPLLSFSFSFGTVGPPCAGELMLMVWRFLRFVV